MSGRFSVGISEKLESVASVREILGEDKMLGKHLFNTKARHALVCVMV